MSKSQMNKLESNPSGVPGVDVQVRTQTMTNTEAPRALARQRPRPHSASEAGSASIVSPGQAADEPVGAYRAHPPYPWWQSLGGPICPDTECGCELLPK